MEFALLAAARGRHGAGQHAVKHKAHAHHSCCAAQCWEFSSITPAAHAHAGDGDEVLANSTGIDTDGVKGADAATPPGAETTDDPNGAAAAANSCAFRLIAPQSDCRQITLQHGPARARHCQKPLLRSLLQTAACTLAAPAAASQTCWGCAASLHLTGTTAALLTLGIDSHAGDGDEVLAPSSEGIDTDGVKGADVAAPPGADTVTDPNGAAAECCAARLRLQHSARSLRRCSLAGVEHRNIADKG